MINYVFVFLGEFGYELLNWQGTIRKFSLKKRENEKIICCTRKGLESFYEYADLYVDISELSLYKQSVANGYMAVHPELNCIKYNELVRKKKKRGEINSLKNCIYRHGLHKQIKDYVQNEMRNQGTLSGKIKFVFSDEFHFVRGLKFGRRRKNPGNIYAFLDLDNNYFVKIESKEECFKLVEGKLGFSLREPYILCQLGYRDIVQLSKEILDVGMIIRDLSKHMKIVVLNFNTGRNLDSSSQYGGDDNCVVYACGSFHEQAVLIANAYNCVFFTEGDFRSHNYVPPFMGKDVYSIASSSIYKLPSTPIKFWNENVFKFGGQIIPVIYENLMSDECYYNNFIIKLLNRKENLIYD